MELKAIQNGVRLSDRIIAAPRNVNELRSFWDCAHIIQDVLFQISQRLLCRTALFNKLQSNRRDYGMRNLGTRCMESPNERCSPSPTFFILISLSLRTLAMSRLVQSALSKVTGGIEHPCSYLFLENNLSREQRDSIA